MAGIYLHIPFCRQACTYCNFHFTTSLRYKDDLVQAVANETALRHTYLNKAPVTTIYFGGGTPSLLAASDIALLLHAIQDHFSIAADAEITLEANPDDITTHKLGEWKAAGINRLSIGVQSFFEEELRWMNRAHNVDQAFQCIEDSLAAGFYNMSIDLIYGSPLLTDEGWEKNVRIATDYGIPHLSCYALTVEEKTPLHKQILKKTTTDIDNNKQARQFLLLMDWLRQRGYEHYEVSNFAKPGFRSRHNSSYWKGEPYLGLGPSAHSFNGGSRSWNIANNNSYIQSINKGMLPSEVEVLTPVQQLNEYIMIALRTKEGLNIAHIEKEWGKEKALSLQKGIHKYIDNDLAIQQQQCIALTDQGMLRADGISADLFF